MQARQIPRTARQRVVRMLEELHLAPRQSAKALTLWPLVRAPGAARCAGRALALSEGLEDGFVSLEAVEDGPVVSHVRVENRASLPLLVLFGEELPAERQTLLANASHLIAPRASLAVPGHMARRPEQGDATHGEFTVVEGQVGFVAAVGDAVAGLEALGHPALFRAGFETLLAPYASQADGAAAPLGGPQFDAPEPFLEALRAARVIEGAALGLGADLRLLGDAVAGCALAGEQVLHLTAFPDFPEAED